MRPRQESPLRDEAGEAGLGCLVRVIVWFTPPPRSSLRYHNSLSIAHKVISVVDGQTHCLCQDVHCDVRPNSHVVKHLKAGQGTASHSPIHRTGRRCGGRGLSPSSDDQHSESGVGQLTRAIDGHLAGNGWPSDGLVLYTRGTWSTRRPNRYAAIALGGELSPVGHRRGVNVEDTMYMTASGVVDPPCSSFHRPAHSCRY